MSSAVSDYGADTPKPLSLWLKINNEEVSEIFVYPIGSTRFSADAWRLPSPMPFTIHNREVQLEIAVEDQNLTDQAIANIKAVFGDAVEVTEFHLYKIGLNAATMQLINYFAVKDVVVNAIQKGIEEDVESLGELTSLVVNGNCCPKGFLAVLRARNLQHLEITVVGAGSRTVLNSIIRQWQNGERELCRWLIHYPTDWRLSVGCFDRVTDHSILRRTTEWEGNQMCATLQFHYRAVNPDYELIVAAADSTTD